MAQYGWELSLNCSTDLFNSIKAHQPYWATFRKTEWTVKHALACFSLTTFDILHHSQTCSRLCVFEKLIVPATTLHVNVMHIHIFKNACVICFSIVPRQWHEGPAAVRWSNSRPFFTTDSFEENQYDKQRRRQLLRFPSIFLGDVRAHIGMERVNLSAS